jgi:general secretion pathway protein L
MTGIIGSITETTARGYRWWAGELRSFLPGRRTAGTARVAIDAIVCADTQGNCVSVQRLSKGRAAAAQFDNPSGFDAAEALTQLARAHPKAKIGILLPFAAFFERRIEIPASARRQAGAILALDFERSTPFKMSEVYSAFALEPAKTNKAKTKNGWLTASQFIVKRRIADRAIASVEDLGLKVVCLDAGSADGASPIGLNLLAISSGAAMSAGSRRPHALMIAASAGLLISAVWIGLSRREVALASLEHDVVLARQAVETVRGARAAAEDVRQNILAVRAFKMGQPSTVEIINTLTHLLPDDVVLSDLKIDRDAVEVSGLTASSAAVVPILERSAAFRDVVFSAPVTFDAVAGKERFSLRIHLRRSLRTLAEATAPGAVQ